MYDGFYNLEQKPFQLNADPDFFFESAGHKRAIAYLRYGLTQGEGFVVVTGAPGTGKTMLVKEMFKTLDEDESIVIGLMVTSHVDAVDTLRVLAVTFGIEFAPDDNKALLLEKIVGFIKQQALQGKRVLLVVDEAQNLPQQSIEELRMLSNFEMDGKIIFQTFLIGQEQLGKLLSSVDLEQVRQRIVATYHLKPMNQGETKLYILYRLKKVGWTDNPVIDEPVFQSIYEFTQGVPRKINTLCERLLLYGYLEELRVIDQEALSQVIAEIEEETLSEEQSDEEPGIEQVEYQNLVKRIENQEQMINNLTKMITTELQLLRKVIMSQSGHEEIFEHQHEEH